MPQRQNVYLRALETLPRLSIHYGNYILNKQWLPYFPEQLDQSGKVMTVQVKRPEEKGSDVSLASHLMMDALRDRADLYAVMTNDSDLVEPMKLLSTEGRRNVALVSLNDDKYNKAFNAINLKTIRKVREGTLQASQLPPVVTDAMGRTIRKPADWS